jgi:hypothetical protein
MIAEWTAGSRATWRITFCAIKITFRMYAVDCNYFRGPYQNTCHKNHIHQFCSADLSEYRKRRFDNDQNRHWARLMPTAAKAARICPDRGPEALIVYHTAVESCRSGIRKQMRKSEADVQPGSARGSFVDTFDQTTSLHLAEAIIDSSDDAMVAKTLDGIQRTFTKPRGQRRPAADGRRRRSRREWRGASAVSMIKPWCEIAETVGPPLPVAIRAAAIPVVVFRGHGGRYTARCACAVGAATANGLCVVLVGFA